MEEIGRYLVIKNIKDNFEGLKRHFVAEKDIKKRDYLTDLFGRSKNLHDMFAILDGASEIDVRSNKPKAVALVQ